MDKIQNFVEAILALALIVLLLPIIFVISLLIKFTSPGPIFHWSKRVGANNKIFMMPKFRTMKINTPQLATHLLQNPHDFYSPIGMWLRKYSLDEVPQLISIMRGDMHFVGPRPALYNQEDLIALRTNAGVDKLVPGVTGWAQINGRDEISIQCKVEFDLEYLYKRSFKFDFYIIFLTLLKVLRKEGISH
tara:strand:- start:3645 stop:4214 length:570 start_codon:yes stop_codon:yes gene_type:complete